MFRGLREHFADTFHYRLVMGGLRPGPAGQLLDDHMRTYLTHHWEAVAERSGQSFNLAALQRADWTYDTEPPARAVVTMRALSPESELGFFERVQRAFYAEAVDVVDEATYPDLVAPFEVDAAAFMALFDSDDMKAATLADFRQARELGINGFPAVVVRRGPELALLTRGWAPLDRLVPALEGWLSD